MANKIPNRWVFDNKTEAQTMCERRNAKAGFTKYIVRDLSEGFAIRELANG
jgi:hypothetical protein